MPLICQELALVPKHSELPLWNWPSIPVKYTDQVYRWPHKGEIAKFTAQIHTFGAFFYRSERLSELDQANRALGLTWKFGQFGHVFRARVHWNRFNFSLRALIKVRLLKLISNVRFSKTWLLSNQIVNFSSFSLQIVWSNDQVQIEQAQGRFPQCQLAPPELEVEDHRMAR